MIRTFFEALLHPNNADCTVFAHSLSRFDLAFIFFFKKLGKISEERKVIFIMKEQDVIGIKIQIGDAKDLRYVTIRDSYLLLPFSLAKLSKFFVTDVSLQKGIEPVLVSSRISIFFVQKDTSHYNKKYCKI